MHHLWCRLSERDAATIRRSALDQALRTVVYALSRSGRLDRQRERPAGRASLSFPESFGPVRGFCSRLVALDNELGFIFRSCYFMRLDPSRCSLLLFDTALTLTLTGIPLDVVAG